jgi:flagellar biosynthesis protein FliP
VLNTMQKAKQYLWAFVELGFLTILSVILIYLILGETSGVFVSTVAANVLKFAGALPAQSLVGLAIVLALVILLGNRTARQADALERFADELRQQRHREAPRTDEALPPAMPIPDPPPQAGEA